MLTTLIPEFGFNAEVFFKGDFCGTTIFDGEGNLGHLHFVRQGTVIMEHAEGDSLVIDVPSVVFYPRPFRHRLVVPAASQAKLVCASIGFKEMEKNPFVAAMPQWVQIPVAEVCGLAHTTEHLFLESSRNEPGQRYVLDRLCDILVFEIIRYVFKQEKLKAGTLAGFTDPGIARVLISIHNAPGADWTIGTMATEASMSRSKFSARFHELVGTTPARYLVDWRLSVAQKLLKKNHSVKAVASAIGYRTQPSFSKAFTHGVGISPKQWLLKERLSDA
jgi:AraC-like DNA-binding protein